MSTGLSSNGIARRVVQDIPDGAYVNLGIGMPMKVGEHLPEDKEIMIDVPLAVKCSLSGFAWPLAAFGEFSSGKMFADESEVTVSPR